MKRTYPIIILALALVLSACGSNAGATPIPTIVINAGDGVSAQPGSGLANIVASGVVVPAQDAQLAFVLGGNVQAVHVREGNQVEAGQLLVELENTAVQVEANQAARTLRELTSPAATAAAEQALAQAQKALEEAQKDADGISFPRASDTLIDNTKAEIDLAKRQLALATDAYRAVSRLPEGDARKAQALLALTNAQLNLNRLQAEYNWYTGKPTDLDIALVQADLDAAKAAYQEAEWYLAALKGEDIPNDATGNKLAQLEQARDAVQFSQERLAQSRLVAPFAGTIVRLDAVAGEYALPGQIIVVISDVTHLQVETTDLSERDVLQVSVGQPVTVTLEAMNESVTGVVAVISPVADTLGGDVVYKTTIDLDLPLPPGLRAGMSVEVQFEAGE